jgi:hypothetical protein
MNFSCLIFDEPAQVLASGEGRPHNHHRPELEGKAGVMREAICQYILI